MKTETSKIVLPVPGNREETELFNKHVLELSDKLVETTIAWLNSFQNVDVSNRPTAQAVGAAAYAALWKLSELETVSEDNRDAMLSGCATTLLKNDTKFQLLIANLPTIPN